MTGVLNTNVHTFAVAPALIVLEIECIKEMGKLIGYSEETSDGIMVPGGTYANMLGFLAARHWKFPHVR